MARRSIKEYVKGISKQLELEEAALRELTERKNVLDASIAAQTAKIEALKGVVAQMTPETVSRKHAKK